MFNIKRIGIAFSVLALVGLVGALMVGPAFASPGNGNGKGPGAKENHKVAVCHYGEERLANAELEITAEDAAWAFINIDTSAELDHVGVHNDGTTYDFVIDEGVAGNTTADCQLLVDSTAEDEGEDD